MLVEVFKTNVQEAQQAKLLVDLLLEHLPGGRINFDLEDCDKILRVQRHEISSAEIISLLNQQGFHCEILSD
jgi:hypothetical protein